MNATLNRAIHLNEDAEFIRTIPEDEFQRLINAFAQHASRPIDWSMTSLVAQHIIRSSWIVESLWKLRYSTPYRDSNHIPSASFASSVLKVWSKVAQSLTELHHHSTSAKTSTIAKASPEPYDDSLPVVHVDMSPIQSMYTAKDVAMHVTDLLQQPKGTTLYPHLDIHSYNCCIDIWNKVSRDYPALACGQVQDLFRAMKLHQVSPDTFSYNTYIDIVAYCGHIPDRPAWKRIDLIHDLWDEMLDCPTAHVNTHTVNSILHAYSVTIGEYMAVPSNNQNARRPLQWESEIVELLNNTEQILVDMKETFERTKSLNDYPDVMTYTTIMDCYSRTCSRIPTAIETVEALFAECKSSRCAPPSIYTYTIILKAWSKTNRPDAPHRAEELLKEFFASEQPPAEEEEPSLIKDNSVVRNTLTNRNKAALYTAVIHCWATSKDSTKAVHALQLLQEMRQRHIVPTVFTYNAALKACAKTRGTTEQQTAALKIAFAILKTMELSSIEPNHTTFAALLQVVSVALPLGTEERNTIAQVLFGRAIRAGQVDARVIQVLRTSCDSVVFQSLMSNATNIHQSDVLTSTEYTKIPLEWRRNVQVS